MASIRRRSGKWQAQIRRDGLHNLSRTFTSKRDAEVWARDAEAKIDRGDIPWAQAQKSKTTLGDLLRRYESEVTPRKRSAEVEQYKIGLILRHQISSLPLTSLTSSEVARFRDERLEHVSTETVRQDLVLVRQAIEVARKEWDLQLPANPVDNVRKPPPAKARERRLTALELVALRGALHEPRNPHFKAVVEFALATAMRRGEILRVEYHHLDARRRTLSVPITKNGSPRTIPVSSSAITIIEAQRSKTGIGIHPFPISGNAIRLAWSRLCLKASVSDLRFHDLRHEAISRFIEQGLSVAEVAHISGHKDLRMLMRYTHLDAEKISSKLMDTEKVYP
jgi:integrase